MAAKGRITYRFDKQSGARVEEQEGNQRAAETNIGSYFQEELKFTSEIGTWNSPFQNDARALEQLIREADGQLLKQEEKKAVKPQAVPIVHEEVRDKLEAETAILLGDEEAFEDDIVPAAPRRAGTPRVIDMYPILEVEEELYRNDQQNIKRTAFGSYLSGSGQRPARGPSWFKVFASVAGAIATGALFGYFVLALFTGSPTDSSDVSPSNTAVSGSPSSGDKTASNGKDNAANADKDSGAAAGTKGNEGKAANVGSGQSASAVVNVNVPAASFYMLQYGVFSSKEGLDAAASELRAKGLAAASLTSPTDYRIYVGMSADKDGAQRLGQALSGMDVYVKQIDVPAVTAIAYKGSASEVQTFFGDTAALVAKLSQLTEESMDGASGSDVNWKELHQQWTESGARVETGMTDKVNKAALLKLMQAVNSAVSAASEYAKKPSDAYLWSMQTSLMEAVFVQKGWFASMESL
ncbi:SPOR domain-containing protein [Paenibacillus sp. R14(2021)]|uniref:SPOR domain-containing protein n=1 Tax=Paenibacillus sp. R14(2021) TaxID=2859228 RepID=UPI001C612876|nr:SPOR domain-containing protein [Paenibacillus sp. R14(2021)]